MNIEVFDLLEKIIGHTDISCSEDYDQESYQNMEKKVSIINGVLMIGIILILLITNKYLLKRQLNRAK